nr:hypothetical protein [Tanacetum cinerariifolium]
MPSIVSQADNHQLVEGTAHSKVSDAMPQLYNKNELSAPKEAKAAEADEVKRTSEKKAMQHKSSKDASKTRRPNNLNLK